MAFIHPMVENLAADVNACNSHFGEIVESGRKLREVLMEITRPRENLPIVEWAEKWVADIPYSPIQGRFRVKNSPMLSAVMEAIASRRIRTVIVVACVQSGKTLAPEIALAFLVANEPGAAMWLDLTDASAKDQAEGRLRPLFENCEPVKALFNPDRNKMRNSTMIFSNGMTLWVAGQNNKKNLQRRSLRYVFGDETWLWEPGRMAEAEARTTAFRHGKCVFMSQGSFEGDDTDKKFKQSSQGEWCFACPSCGDVQPFEWKHLEWERAPDGAPTRVRLVCRKCGRDFPNSAETRRALNATGRFVFANPAASHIAGFHWNALATMDWSDLARQYLAAKAAADKGDISDLTVFYQKRLAEAWKDDSDDQELVSQMVPAGEYSFGDPWSEEGRFDLRRACAVPAGAEGSEKFPPLRFMTVDVQEGYFYFVVRAWSAGGSSRLIDCGMLQFFDDVAARAKQHNVLPVFTFLDCGFNADQVFRFCAETGFTALRGTGKNEWQFRGGAKRYYSPRELVACGNGKFARRHYFSNLRCKDILAVLRSGRASATWEIPRDAPVNYLKMLSSERRDNLKQVWEQIGQRPNHYFDCEVMNVCAALMLNLVGLKSDGGSQ